MPRGTKRKAEQMEEGPDAQQFADAFCKIRSLCAPHLVGSCALEKECMRYADEARQAYKEQREDGREEVEAASPRPGVMADESVLTPAQKYSRRLKNNRKSAAASKVYAEVLRRAQASALQNNLPGMGSVGNGWEIERDGLLQRITNLQAELLEERKKIEDMSREMMRVRGRQVSFGANYERMKSFSTSRSPYAAAGLPASQSTVKAEDYRLLDESEPALQLSTQEFDMVNTQMGSHPGHNPTQQSYAYSQPSASAYLNDQPNSQTNTESQVQPESQHTPGSRLVVEKHSSSLALSNVGHESDAKAFTTGMTCTQSQGEDPDDRVLRHPSLPMSSASLPISSGGLALMPGSQPSQDFDFFVSSQGNSQPKSG